ncbi:gamma-glutamyltransferase [Primorskyibacter flagellatus]|uniref:Gamma-glutamyltransferase n=1 Tax=Primorskyibacter flagellatus TaxID=1387277 RepID=A0A916ZXK8_9RHOB|nr:gamma-glutamyltransferase [Primorskyibacter flagellatus]GGE16192.1 gamma-glutamyltransferase [Primorskyibacter flagellatus]
MYSATGRSGAIAAPHAAAARTGLSVLQDGGSAIEAMVAAAATIAVTYPHMNGIGGDGFWLVSRADGTVTGISAAGRAAALATAARYAEGIPARGPQAALTVPTAIAGWQAALDLMPTRMPLSRLLRDAITWAGEGSPVTESQSRHTSAKLPDLIGQPGFAEIFAPSGTAPEAGVILANPALAQTLDRMARLGLRDFYDGETAAQHGAWLAEVGSPLRAGDLAAARAEVVMPLSAQIRSGTLWNMPPPTQGAASLMILGVLDRLGGVVSDGTDLVHRVVEATKPAFRLRNDLIGDPDHMTVRPGDWLTDAALAAMAGGIDLTRAAPWPDPPRDGGTIWMGASDRDGTMVSYIQSVFWEFGSGIVCPATGVLFQNRGAAFSLAEGPNVLRPGARPFHTLNPAMARLSDGRRIAYGTMGGEGQPQTQAAIFARHVMLGQPLGQAIDAPRWLLGRTWGEDSTTLKLEARFGGVIDDLAALGHETEAIADYSDLTGHAGAVVLHPDGTVEAAHDPRADGGGMAW